MRYEVAEVDNDGVLLNNLRKVIGLYRAFKGRKNRSEFRESVEPDIYRFFYNEGIRPQQEELKKYERLYLRYLQRYAKLFDGARELLQYLHEAKIRVGIASETSRRIHVSTILEKTGTSDFIEAIVAKEDRRGRNKWEVLSERLGVTPSQAVAVDDMTQGIGAAVDAGIGKVYAATYGFHPKKKLVNYIKAKQYNNVELVDNIPQLILKLSQDFEVLANRINQTPAQTMKFTRK